MNIQETIIQLVIIAIISTVVTILYIRRMIKAVLPTGVKRMASAYASMMGQKSGVVRRGKRTKKLNAEAKEKIADGLLKEIPFGGKIKEWGLTPDHLFSLLADKEFISGIAVLYNTTKSVIGILPSLPNPLSRERRSSDRGVPKMKQNP